MDVLTILFWTIIMIVFGLYIMTIVGKPSNPLIPEYLIIEPINLYSSLIMVIGILIPFLFVKQTFKQTEKDDIGTQN